MNKAADVHQVLGRDQVNLLLKEAPKVIGTNCIDQKSFHDAMRKAFCQLGTQKLTFVEPSHKRRASDPGMASKPYAAAASPTLSAAGGGVSNNQLHEFKGMKGVFDDDVASINSTSCNGLFKKKGYVKANSSDIRELEKKCHNSKEIEGDLNWISTFDLRFDSSLQKLEHLRDQTHIA